MSDLISRKEAWKAFDECNLFVNREDRDIAQEVIENLPAVEAKPFDWNDNMSEIAMEDFETIRSSLNYCQSQTIGMALAKLQLLEEQGCKVIENNINNK